MMLRRIWRRGGGSGFIFCIVILLPLAFVFHLLLSATGLSDDEKESLDVRISALREHMDHLRSLDKEKSKAFLELQQQLHRYLSDSKSPSKDTSRELPEPNKANIFAYSAASLSSWPLPAPLSSQTMANLSGININQTLIELYRNGLVADVSPIATDMAVPNIYDHLPHLLQNPRALSPVVRISKNRRHVHTTIGIPTIKRPKVSYLITTLRSLIDNLQPSERAEILIVVFFAETGGLTEFITEQVATIYNEFPDAVNEGLLEIVVPSAAFYPNLDAIPPTFDDSPDRMKWRTKQNLDYCYLMMYCQNRATYYLQLEDDVLTKPGYVERIKEFIRKHSSSTWYLLEFSSLGFIGKLFRSSDLPLTIDFLLMFHKEKPADWLLDHIFYVRLCHPEKSPKQCQQIKNQYRLLYKPSLFQHIGVHSSLKGKVQKLKEKDFGKSQMHRPHMDNPPAEITTSLKTYQKYSLESAYKGEAFFWGLLPQPGDWINFKFAPPIRLEGFTFRSGNAEHPDDLFYNTSVEITFTDGADGFATEPGSSPISYPKTDDGYFVVAWFKPSGAATASGLNTTGTVSSLRVVVHSESTTWIILSELWIRPFKDAVT